MKNARHSKAASSANGQRNFTAPEQLSFLPPPEIFASLPPKGTHHCAAFDRMLTGERLTQPSFGLSRWRLAAYIMELKYLGWPIKRADVSCPGHNRPIAEYWLEPDAIAAARSMRGAA